MLCPSETGGRHSLIANQIARVVHQVLRDDLVERLRELRAELFCENGETGEHKNTKTSRVRRTRAPRRGTEAAYVPPTAGS